MSTTVRVFRCPAAFLLALAWTSVNPAVAEPGAPQKAAAEALFQQATELLESGKFSDACSKFEGSQELDPALGTMLRLADCYDRVGRTASAWALFLESAANARSSNQPEREQIAAQRARDLEARLSTIQVSVPSGARVEGLLVRLNGAIIPTASWDAPIPVDPGGQRVEMSAPDHEPWSGVVEVAAGPTAKKMTLVALKKKPKEPAATRTVIWSAPRAPSSESSGQSTFGVVIGGIGVAGLVAGGILGYRAYDLNQDSLNECRAEDPNACTPRGKSVRDAAETSALAATIGVAAGGLLLATGVALVLSAPRTKESASSRLLLRSSVSQRGARFGLEGEF